MSGNIVISIDPGLTTGICVADNINGRSFDVQSSFTVTWDNRFELLETFRDLQECNIIDAIVIERFMLYPDKAASQSYNEFPSVRIIGLCEAYLYQLDLLDKVVYQNASQRKGVAFVTEHYPLVKATLHQRDAYQHLRYYILTHQKTVA